MAAFKAYNAGRLYADQVKPWNFLAMAHPTTRERTRRDGPRSLVAAFERDPVKRRAARWFDRGNSKLEAKPIRTDDQDFVRDDSFAVLRYGDYFDAYRSHPELKGLAPDATPCHRWTRGVLRPRQVQGSGAGPDREGEQPASRRPATG